MAKCNPAWCKVFVKVVGFLKVLASLRVLLDQEVIASNCIPGDCRVGVGTDQFVSQVVEFTLFLLLDEYTAEKWHNLHVKRIFFDYFAEHIVCFSKLLFVCQLFCLNKSDLEGILFCEKLHDSHLHSIHSLFLVSERRCNFNRFFGCSQALHLVVCIKDIVDPYRTYSIVL